MVSPAREAVSRLPASGTSASSSTGVARDRKSTRLNSSHSQISYAVFCLKKKNQRSKDRGPLTICISLADDVKYAELCSSNFFQIRAGFDEYLSLYSSTMCQTPTHLDAAC